jgi:DNA-binding MarR family transcriptional regulator
MEDVMADMNYDGLKLEKQVCFPLYACARETIKLYKPFLDKLDLTYTQYITMLVLWEQEHVTVKELGERLYLDSGTLTPLLKKLEEKGLVDRRRSTVDERNLIVSITQKGAQLREQAVDIPKEMAKCLVLDKEETKVLYRLLYKMLTYLSE